MKRKDLTGQTFGHLRVLSSAGAKAHPCGQKHLQWLCACDCGNHKIVAGNSLAGGHTTSCGCRKGGVLHGHARGYDSSPAYKSWHMMKARCLNARHDSFPRYGGRGITVCERWLKFENFLSDMGERPKGTSLERRNNNGNYEPENCYWATRHQQMNNTCTNVFVEHRGERLTIAQWAKRLNIHVNTLGSRLKRGLSPTEAFYQEKQNHKLSKEQIEAIRSDVRLQKVIAAEYGVSQSAVSRIRNAT